MGYLIDWPYKLFLQKDISSDGSFVNKPLSSACSGSHVHAQEVWCARRQPCMHAGSCACANAALCMRRKPCACTGSYERSQALKRLQEAMCARRKPCALTVSRALAASCARAASRALAASHARAASLARAASRARAQVDVQALWAACARAGPPVRARMAA